MKDNVWLTQSKHLDYMSIAIQYIQYIAYIPAYIPVGNKTSQPQDNSPTHGQILRQLTNTFEDHSLTLLSIAIQYIQYIAYIPAYIPVGNKTSQPQDNSPTHGQILRQLTNTFEDHSLTLLSIAIQYIQYIAYIPAYIPVGNKTSQPQDNSPTHGQILRQLTNTFEDHSLTLLFKVN